MFISKKREQKLLEKITMIKPTSKEGLKKQCLMLCHLDIDKAEKMYDFLTRDMEGLPDLEATTKPFFQNIGDQTNRLFGWIRENQDVISQTVDFVKGLVSGKKTPPAAPLPPING